jgi:hypothetical protein
MQPKLAQDFSLPICATIGWALMSQSFGLYQIVASAKRPEHLQNNPNKRFDYSYSRWQIADRTMMNCVEQSFTFGCLLWMHAVFVDAPMAGTLGLVAVVFRLLYPLLRGVKEIFMEFSTQPYQACVGIMGCNLLSASLRSGALVVEELNGSNALAMLGCYLAWSLCAAALGLPGALLLGSLVEEPKGAKSKQ